MPEGAIYVGRPTKWGNPFSHGRYHDASSRYLGKQNYREWFKRQRGLKASLSELRGHDLVCWCPLDQSCHADVLLELANGKPARTVNGWYQKLRKEAGRQVV